MESNKCPKCGAEYQHISGVRNVCRCHNPKMYDVMKQAFDDLFAEEEHQDE